MKLDNVADIYPLSPLQQGILFETLVSDARDGVYVEQFGYRLRGPLDVAAFRAAWQTLLDRHVILRTAFLWDGLDKPVQVVRKSLALPWTELDWRAEPATAHPAAIAALQASDRATGFAPEQAPLMRLTLARLGDAEWFFLWSHHHLLLDGWCIPILVRELIDLYNGAASLPPTRPYRDYIGWLQQQDAAAAQHFWREALAGFAAPTPLLASLSASTSTGYGHREHRLPPPLRTALEAMARQHRLTLNTVFQGAWALLLARICDVDDVVFGATVSGRPADLRGVETMVGLFINTLPVRVDIPEGETVATWLARLQERQRDQEAHAHLPLAEIQRCSDVRGPLFETLLVFENFPLTDAAMSRSLEGGLTVETSSVVERASYKLVLAVLPGDNIVLRFYHDAAAVEPESVDWLAGLLETLLTGIAADPAAEPLRLPLMQAEPFVPPVPSAPAICLHHAFEAVAARAPDAVAVTAVDADGRMESALSYGALNAAANRLAHRLQAEDVAVETRIGLRLEPGPGLIIAMLGILKAGGCYVPVDPAQPEERQAMILRDAGVHLLVTAADLPPLPAMCPELYLDQLVGEDASNPVVAVTPTSAAYVIYTSGSTGRPKGVVVEHANVARLLSATAHWFGFGPDDCWALFHSAAFDFSVWEIWGALLHGGRLITVPYLLAREPRAFHRMLRQQAVTVLNQTPSAFRQFIEADAALDAALPALRLVIFGGEALDLAMLAPWFARHAEDAPRLVNMYGITETTVHVTYHPIRAAEAVPGPRLIGEAIPDLVLMVRDRFGAPVPTGLPGELYVGGAGVARGYLDRPALNAERFHPHADGRRYYRSGDLVRQLPGMPPRYAFLGRVDEQVKIRGYRVEPAEIAAQIAAHPGVAECHVLAVPEPDTGGGNRLVAYVVPHPVTAGAIRRALRWSAAPGPGTRRLPNGLPVAELNANETGFLYREIFEDRCYLRHGLTLRPGDVVFDVGANIGLFSLFAAAETGYRARIYAFEPAESVHAVLARNFALHGLEGAAEPLGLSDHAGEAELRFFPHLSIMSGRDARVDAVRDTVLAYEQGRGTATLADEVLDYRLESEKLAASFTTVSAAMGRHGIDRIDFLKIDVERSEIEVLQGIGAQDWPRIRQIVVEVHDEAGRADAVAGLLRDRGFIVAIDAPLDAARLVNLYARRPEPPPAAAEAPYWYEPEALAASIRDAARHALPAHMVPSEIVLLDRVALTRNGKIDRHALARETALAAAPPASVPPAGEDEALLAAIWGEVLSPGAARAIGRDDNFFELGGHSLLATRVASRVRDVFAVALAIREVFEHPTIAGLAACIAAHRRRGRADATALPPIQPDPAARYEPFPLTEIQQAYWLGRSANFELGNVATHGYLEADCPGLELPRFERSWQLLVERHDMLRMVVLPGGQQQVGPPGQPYRIVVRDLRGQPADAALAELRASLSHQMLDATTGPLFDISASVLDGGVTRLHFSIDALWGDAHSLRVLMAELFQLYRAPDTALPPLALSFRDYVLAERSWRETSWYAESLRYWHDRLIDFPSGPDLPLAINPATLHAPRFDRRAGRLERDDWHALKRRAALAGLTPTGVLMAAFAEVLASWSKTPRFAINLTLFNRHPVHPAVNRVVGDFTSLLLLDVDHGPADRFRARARRVQLRLWQDLDHRIVNGVTVLRELARRNGGTPVAMPVVFTSTLGLAASAAGAAPPGEVVFSITQTPQVWLDHKVSESEGALKFEWDAIEALFPPGVLDAMFETYAAQLERLARSDAAWQESSAERLPPAAQMTVRQAINATAAPLPPGLLHEPWLRAAAHAMPAVIDADGTLTHATLADRARVVAAGLSPAESPVAIVMEKGWAQLAAVMGVLMAGRAYVPLDPDLPRERLALLLARIGARVALTQPWLRDRLAWPEDLQIVVVDGEAGAERTTSSPAQPGDLAYVIFTSGSTGEPKGVMIDHRGALNTVADINARFGVGASDRVLSLSALGFDLSVYDIFGLLGVGGAVVLPRPDRRRSPDHWLELMAAHAVTVWNSVPALMMMLLDHLEERGLAPPPGLRLVLLSGDWIPLNLPGRIRAAWPDATVISLGGATEASIWSIAHPVAEELPGWTSVPYGRPLANQYFHVLDGALAPRPDWVAGELFIAGAGLAMGYWQDKARTAASFFRHPRTGERLYRTGDLARYRPDGTLEFLGREDHQIKLRGHRIELGEIEAALLGHPEVRDAVVTLQGDRHAPQRLVAHVVVPERQAAEDVAFDPGERLRFKLSHPGVRSDAELGGIALPPPDPARRDMLLRRRSHRRFAPDAVGLETLAGLLAGLMASDVGSALPRRAYPSAGSLYPVQAYLSVKPGRVTGLAGGLYYYHPLSHRLLSVAAEAAEGALFGPPGGYNRAIEDEAAFALLLVDRPAAIRPVYGEAARDFALLEAGAMAQLLMQLAPEHGLGLCPVGRMDFAPLHARLRLEEGQTLLHGLLGGRSTPTTAWPEQPAPLAERLARHLAERLPAYMLPAAFLELPALPMTANGKLDRAALRSATPPAVARPEGFAAPRDWLEQSIAEQWQALLDRRSPIGTGDNFFDFGGDSLLAVRLATQLSRRLQHPLMLTDIFNHPTVAEQATLLRNQMRPDSSVGLVTMRGGPGAPFFCFPGSGGHALYLYHLARHLPDVPFYALQSAAVDGETAPVDRIEPMADHFLVLIRSVQPRGPYRLGGHSLGAKIALEVAQRLLAAGEAVTLLAVFDGLPFFDGESVVADWDEPRWLAGLISAAAGFGGAAAEDEGAVIAQLAPLDPEARLLRVKTALEQHRFLPEHAGLPQVRAMVALFRANTQAHLHYRPKPVARVPVVLFAPAEQGPAAREAMYRAWEAIGPVALHVTAGSHLTMLAEPHVATLAEAVASALRG